jgi:peptidoglycan-associated lipoprotein
MHKKNCTSPLTLAAVFVVGIGLLSMVGCSQNTASDSSEMAMGRQGADTQKFFTSARSQSANGSSLEAHQRGALGDHAGALADVHFDFDRYDLMPYTRDTLNQVHATWLKAHPQASVEIEGHGDDRGTSEYNLALGAKRAENVKRYLIDLGIAANRLSTISYGEELQLCNQQNEACWAKNRRAHFVVKTASVN